MTDRAEGRTDAQRIRRVTLVGALANLLLAALKIVGGKIVGSVSLMGDGIHSLSDLVTDVIVLVGVALGGKPPDSDHPYGHGRYETVASILVSAALVIAGALLVVQVVRGILSGEETTPGLAMVVLAAISIVVKELLFQVTRRVARRTHSTALVANAWHHRSDALSSLAVLGGGLAGLLGLPHGDHVAGLVVGLMIAIAGLKIGTKGASELMESSVGEDVLRTIRAVLDGHAEVRGWHALRARRVGRDVFADVHILLDPDMTVLRSHDIADELERSLREKLEGRLSISIHVEPHGEVSETTTFPP
jgi:cation diffusion facilitator family transporter